MIIPRLAVNAIDFSMKSPNKRLDFFNNFFNISSNFAGSKTFFK